jgi:hypothetical protein
MLAFLEVNEWHLVSKALVSEGKQKGGLLSGRFYMAVLHSMDRVDEKMVWSKPMSVTPLDLLLLVLAYGGEEVRTAVNCYELDISRLSMVISNDATKKTIDI